MRTLLDGLGILESPRWHDGRLWFCDWGAAEVRSLGRDGHHRLELRVPTSLPFSIDWLPDGRLLVVSGQESLLLRRDDDGSLRVHADLRSIDAPFNELVVDARGNAYVNGESLALVTPEGVARRVADKLEFGNGMAITPDGSTLLVAESHGHRITAFEIEPDGDLSGQHVWADLGNAAPDGICVDAGGAVWYADVPHRRCVRVGEGGTVLGTVEADRGCFACMLGGEDGRTLYVAAATWYGMDRISETAGTGQILAASVDMPHAGWP